ncbi:MAG: class I SAM-dependent methyltransferase [Deltaproteobacteria bacterium]|nr:class I SAM-dependent methyltransferase [Deltaproteobacteria bacterium]
MRMNFLIESTLQRIVYFASRYLGYANLAHDFAQKAGLFIAEKKQDYLYVDPSRITDLPCVEAKLALDLDVFRRFSEKVISENRTLLRFQRLFVIWQALYNVRHLKLPMVEVGSYRGGSAYFISAAMRHFTGEDIPLHAFDTFEGHPLSVLDHKKDPYHAKGMFSDTSYQDVVNYLLDFKGVVVHKGEFFENIGKLPDGKISFCHVDVDTYLTTKRCILQLMPRLAASGILLLDDFGAGKCPGVTKGVNEILDKLAPYQMWQMQTEQLLIIKR